MKTLSHTIKACVAHGQNIYMQPIWKALKVCPYEMIYYVVFLDVLLCIRLIVNDLLSFDLQFEGIDVAFSSTVDSSHQLFYYTILIFLGRN